MSWAKYVIPSAFAFAVSGFVTMKYQQLKKDKDDIELIQASGRMSQYLQSLHDGMAFHLDAILNQYERSTKIADYRKVVCEYCDGEVLETCVGTSRNGKYYKPGTKVTFIDWSPNMIEVAISKSYPFLNTKFTIGDVKAMPYADNTYDTVVDTFGLEYVDEPELALQEMKRVCKPNGNILLLEHGMPSLPETYSWFNFKMGSDLKKGGYFCNRHWDKELEKHKDLEVVRHQRKVNGTIYFYVLRNCKPANNNDSV